MITLFLRGLPRSATEESVTSLFSNYGAVRSIKLVKDIFSGECKGFATIDMEGHDARAAIKALDRSDFNGSQISVGVDHPRNKGHGRRRRS